MPHQFAELLKRFFPCVLGLLCAYPPLSFIKREMVAPSDWMLPRLALSGIALGCVVAGFWLLWKHRGAFRNAALWVVLALAVACELAYPSSEGDTPVKILSVLTVSCTLYILFGMMRKWASIVIFPFLVLLCCMLAVKWIYGMEIDANLMAQIIGASPQDVEQFVTLQAVLWGIAALLGVLAVSVGVAKSQGRQRALPVFLLGLGIAAPTILSSFASFTPCISVESQCMRTPSMPFQLTRAYSLAKLKNGMFVKIASSLSSPADSPTSMGTLSGGEGVVCIVHIGESMRADHLAFNGYHRHTMPWLESCENIINFPVCISSAPYTTQAVFVMLTNGQGMPDSASVSPELRATTGSFMDLFRANGFDCRCFFNTVADRNNEGGAVFEQIQRVLTGAAGKMYRLSGDYHPKNQLPQLAEAIRECKGANAFFLVNNLGSHIPFNMYDRDNPAFSPSSPNAASSSPGTNPEAAEQTLNAYDNTLVYTDEYLHALMENLQGRPYIYIYMSDHGEPLGDGGHWVRDIPNGEYHKQEWCKVGFFILYSPEFEQLHPHFAAALKNLRHNSSKEVGQGHLFHTVLGIFGISSPYYEAEMDLSSEQAKPYTGPSPSRGGKAADGLIWL